MDKMRHTHASGWVLVLKTERFLLISVPMITTMSKNNKGEERDLFHRIFPSWRDAKAGTWRRERKLNP